MKKDILISVALIIICQFCTSFKNKEARSKLVKFDENLYVSATEVSNHEYLEFLHYLQSNNQQEKYAICLFDSTKWKAAIVDSEPLVGYYHRHPAYSNYPIVNITKEAMELYCGWLTSKYENSSDRKYKKVVYRLPTDKEYQKMISQSADKFTSANPDKNAQANVKPKIATDQLTDLTTPVYAYKPDKMGLYNTIGNVSEVTKEGKISGGNFSTYIEECSVGKYQQYALPDARVGFRYVMEIIEY